LSPKFLKENEMFYKRRPKMHSEASFESKNGFTTWVRLYNTKSTVVIYNCAAGAEYDAIAEAPDCGHGQLSVPRDDIPKLIQALQAAYDYKG
jgi:hypothetical protein